MENAFIPTQKVKKRIFNWVIIAEFVILILMLKSFVYSYSLTVSIVLLIIMFILVVGLDIFVWKKISSEFLNVGEVGLETNDAEIEWEFVEEIRLKTEKEKPTFLIFRVYGEYIKIPLRLFDDQIETILKAIEGKGFKITE